MTGLACTHHPERKAIAEVPSTAERLCPACWRAFQSHGECDQDRPCPWCDNGMSHPAPANALPPKDGSA